MENFEQKEGSDEENPEQKEDFDEENSERLFNEVEAELIAEYMQALDDEFGEAEPEEDEAEEVGIWDILTQI